MLPIGSGYDRGTASAAMAARPILDRLESGETIPHEDAEALDDMAWNNYIRDRVEEVPGEGYRLVREPPTPDDLRAWRESEDLTQEQAAQVAGVQRLAWARWETGERSVPQWLADTLRQRWGSAP